MKTALRVSFLCALALAPIGCGTTAGVLPAVAANPDAANKQTANIAGALPAAVRTKHNIAGALPAFTGPAPVGGADSLTSDATIYTLKAVPI